MKILLALPMLAALTISSTAQELVEKVSPHSVEETVQRLTTAIETTGAIVFAEVDHGAGARSVEGDVGDMVLVIFGNPAIGTPIIEAAPLSGLDLPIRVLVYSEDEQTKIAYEAASALREHRDIEGADEALQAMEQAVGRLTDAALTP